MSPEVLSHRLEGEGPTVLLLNGGMMTAAAWEPVAAPLRARYRVLRCDFRGQLLSPGDPRRELAGNLEDLIELLDHHAVDRVHVIGTSFGGEVAMLLAAQHPQRLLSLTAVTVTDHTTEEMERSTRDLRALLGRIRAGADPGLLHDRLVEGVYSKDFVDASRGDLAVRRAQIGSLPDAWFEDLDGILQSVESFDLRPHLGRIRCPALVITAADDRALPPERGRAIAAAIAGAQLAEHPSSGHALVVEDPEWLTGRCLEFIDSC